VSRMRSPAVGAGISPAAVRFIDFPLTVLPIGT
jgi:hypothetical protein